MEPNFYLVFLTAIIPLVVGALWYGPLFQNPWMKAADMTHEKMEGANMMVIFGLTYVLGVVISFILSGSVIHQSALYSLFVMDPTLTQEGSELYNYMQDFMNKYGDMHRSFGHGAVHGVLMGLGFFTPIFAINAMFERKGFKYIAINGGFWIVCLALMGGVLCAWM